MYPVLGAPTKARGRLDLGDAASRRPRSAQGRRSRSASASGRPPTPWTGSARCSTPSARSWSNAKGDIVIEQSDAPEAGARVRAAPGEGDAAGRVRLGRRLEQQVPHLGPGLDDHEPALAPTRSPSATTRRSPSTCTPSRCPRGRRAATRRTCPSSGACGSSRKNKARGEEPARTPAGSARTSRSMVAASVGYDIPSFESLRNFKTWERGRAAQGHGVPLPAASRTRSCRWPARRRPCGVANQIYVQGSMTKMIAKCTQGGEGHHRCRGDSSWAC